MEDSDCISRVLRDKHQWLLSNSTTIITNENSVARNWSEWRWILGGGMEIVFFRPSENIAPTHETLNAMEQNFEIM